jgi:hypothetical protein
VKNPKFVHCSFIWQHEGIADHLRDGVGLRCHSPASKSDPQSGDNAAGYAEEG